jgi:molecular chaperone DnaK (HSP70)
MESTIDWSRGMRRIAVDFGTDRTVIAMQDGTVPRYPELPGFTWWIPSPSLVAAVPAVTCLIHYSNNGAIKVGEEVITCGLAESPSTVRRMVHYIVTGNPARLDSGRTGSQIGYPDAGAAFLRILLDAVPVEVRDRETEIIFVVPADAGEHYVDWIRSTGLAAGARTTRVIDDITATILGYGLPAIPGRLYLLIDIDEGSLTVTVAAAGCKDTSSASLSSRVLGRAEDETGSARVDAWIAEDVLDHHRLRTTDTRVQALYGELLRQTGRARERLAAVTETMIRASNRTSSVSVEAVLNRIDLERILTTHGFLPLLRRTIDRAVAAAHSRGYAIDATTAVLLTGGGCTMPCLQDAIVHWFGRDLIYGDHAPDARVQGALAAVAVAPEDLIKNNYAVRYWDSSNHEHRYRFLVRAGTSYPSAGQIGRFVISAAYDGQTHLGIPLYSLGRGTGIMDTTIELVSDATGGMRIHGPAPGAAPDGKQVWVNERAPTMLIASPPATRGEPRFELTFTIDSEKQLCLTARDVVTGDVVKRDVPVYRLI